MYHFFKEECTDVLGPIHYIAPSRQHQILPASWCLLFLWRTLPQALSFLAGFTVILTWSSLEEEEENSKEQVEDPHGCQLFVDCVLLQNAWKTKGGWRMFEEEAGKGTWYL